MAKKKVAKKDVKKVVTRKISMTRYPIAKELPKLALISGSGNVWHGVVARLRVYDQPGSTGKRVFVYLSPGWNSNYVGCSDDPNMIHALFLARDNGNSIWGYSNPGYRIEWLDY